MNSERFEILFRGGEMDGRRTSLSMLTPFVEVPCLNPRGGFGTIRYRQAEKISNALTVYELDTERH